MREIAKGPTCDSREVAPTSCNGTRARRALAASLVWLAAAGAGVAPTAPKPAPPAARVGATRSPEGTKTVTSFLRIWIVSERQHDGTWVVAVRWPGRLDALEGGHGAFNRFTPAKKQGDRYVGSPEVRPAGTCLALRTGPALAFVSVSPSTSSAEDAPRGGDFCELPIQIAADVYQGVVLDVARAGVELLANHEEIVFTDVAAATSLRSEADENALLDKMAAQVREAVAQFQYVKLWLQRIEKGRYAGRTIRDVMGNCSPDDVRNFLDSVREYPAKYIGTPLKLSDVFTAWLLAKESPRSATTGVCDVLQLGSDSCSW